MAILKATATQDFDVIPEGEVLEVALMDVSEHEFTWNEELIEKFNWEFIVTEEGPWKGQKVRGQSSRSFNPHPNCVAYNWVKALTGKAYGPGDELDTADLIGLKARAIIKHRPDKKQPDRVWVDVDKLVPAKAAAQSPEDTPF